MKWTSIAAVAAGLVGSAAAQAESEPYTDAETGIVFQQYPSADGIKFRVALPGTIEAGQPYDVILQIEAPKSIGWVGWAWAGQMTYNPLTVIWPNGDQVMHSSRMAFGYSTPSPYADATYQVLKGTGIKGDTLKFTALCKGCSSWTDFTGEPFTVDASQEARFAYAFSANPVATPSDNATTFTIHDGVGHWYHDLPGAKSASFADWVAKNTVGAAPNGTAPGTNGTTVFSAARPRGAAAPLRFMERVRRDLGADARNRNRN
ncbi:actin-domain-containing protein [Apiospora arundinis]|uniref:Actin-domain-containing protein n=1 Tax=Apiospora arundinis TaxID=335852 RepID=A0ABR2I8R0_9PEZI